MRIIEVAGSFRSMGQAFGEETREAIGELYEARVRNAIVQARAYGGRRIEEASLIELAKRCVDVLRKWQPPVYEELLGIAEGAAVSLPAVWTMNALTDVRDVAAFGDPAWMAAPDDGCTALLADERPLGGGVVAGQTWDLATDNLPYVCVLRRRPEAALRTTCLTLVGCLSLIGLNEAGLAVGTTNIRGADSRPGVGYLDVLHAALAHRSRETAEVTVVSAPRAGAHYYWLADPAGWTALECTARRQAKVARTGAYVHTNHMTESVRVHEVAGTPMASSHARHARLSELVDAAERPLTDEWLKHALADTANGELAIDRRDFDGISTNAAVVVVPAEGRVWVVHGPASRGTWLEV
jgi:isopenicillin-N N-acyltransferase-like protein